MVMGTRPREELDEEEDSDGEDDDDEDGDDGALEAAETAVARAEGALGVHALAVERVRVGLEALRLAFDVLEALAAADGLVDVVEHEAARLVDLGADGADALDALICAVEVCTLAHNKGKAAVVGAQRCGSRGGIVLLEAARDVCNEAKHARCREVRGRKNHNLHRGVVACTQARVVRRDNHAMEALALVRVRLLCPQRHVTQL